MSSTRMNLIQRAAKIVDEVDVLMFDMSASMDISQRTLRETSELLVNIERALRAVNAAIIRDDLESLQRGN